MKAQNLFIAFVTCMLLSLGNVALADDGMSGESAESMSVNINTASAEVLAEKLTGVGLSRAKAIVAYRESFGPFYSAEELTAVKGIGSGTVAKNSAKIVIE